MNSIETPKRIFNEAEAAHYLDVSKHTLRKQRSDGERENHMPIVPYIKLGRSVRYTREDLDEFIDKLKEASLTE